MFSDLAQGFALGLEQVADLGFMFVPVEHCPVIAVSHVGRDSIPSASG